MKYSKTITLILVITLIGMIAVSSLSTEAPIKDEIWNQIDEDDKFSLQVYDYSDEGKFVIGGMYWEACGKMIFGEDTQEVESIIRETFGDRKILIIYLQAFQNAFFYPTEFTFIQGISQYDIGYSGYIAIDDSFSGSELKSGVITYGIIAVPEGIDTGRPFEIYYDDDKTEL